MDRRKGEWRKENFASQKNSAKVTPPFLEGLLRRAA